MTITEYAHIIRDDAGHLRIGGGLYKLIMLVAEHVYHGSSPVEIVGAHPALTLGQAYEALAYYYDHKEALDAELVYRARYAAEMEAAQGNESRRLSLTEEYERGAPGA